MFHSARRSLGVFAVALTGLMAESVHAGQQAHLPGVPGDAPAAEMAMSNRHGGRLEPGEVLSREPLPAGLWLPATRRAYRLRYLSKGQFGSPAVVSGAVFIPQGQSPAKGWPVVSWGHGTVGVADTCAPSTAGRSTRDITYLSAWLRAGYAVVASDYRGLGTSGRHPYIDGVATARDMIDMVRAAFQADPALSRSWFAVGQSQGAHAALFAGVIASRYAPELDFRGTIATAPPTQWRMTITETHALDPVLPANPLAMLIFAGLETSHRLAFDASDYLTDAGSRVYRDALRTECVPATIGRLAGLTNGAAYDIDERELERLIRLLEDEDIPVGAYARPIYIAQGSADRVVYPPATARTVDQLRAAGSDVTFAVYPGADHDGVLAAAVPDLLVWAAHLLAAPVL